MGVGLSGMISGLDTDSIVKAMVSGQQAKATKVENKITLNKWTKEAWSGLNTKIYSFYTKYASKLRLQSSYMTRTATSSNESVVKATAGSGAAVGTHSLQVKKLASSQYVTGGQLSKTVNTYNKNSKLVDLGGEGKGVAEGTIITIKGNKGTTDEKEVKLEVTKDTTINDFLTACKDVGLTASFDTNQQRFFISSSESGEDDAFSITTNMLNDNTTSELGKLEADTEINGSTIKLIDTSVLTSAEKTSYEEAMSTIRKNIDLVFTVLDEDSYNSTDKTQKAVMDAINMVKDIAEKTYADKKANSDELSEIDGFNMLNKLTSTDKLEGKYGDLYTYESLANKAKENIAHSIKSEYAINKAKERATNTLNEKWNALNLSADNYLTGTELAELTNGLTATEVSKLATDKVTEAKAKKAELEGKDNLTTDQEAELQHAIKVINTWGYKIDGKQLSNIYEEAYNAQYKISYDNYETETGSTITYVGAEVAEEMKNILINTDVYKNNVATKKTEILSAKEDTAEVIDRKDTIEEILRDSSENSGWNNQDLVMFSELEGLVTEPTDLNDPNYQENYENYENYQDAIAKIRQNPTMLNEALKTLDELGTGNLDDLGLDTNLKGVCEAIQKAQNIVSDKDTFMENLKGLAKDEYSDSLSAMGLGKIEGTAVSQNSDGTGMVVVEASNSEFTLDGATMTETSNSFTVNGITLNLSGTTQNKDDASIYDIVQITVGKDVDSTYKLVKEAITEYNKLLEEMNTLYNADSARGYDPLTDEQKEAMTETDIENWEKKIKDSLLRRDDTLGTLLTSMRNALSSSYTDEDGKTYALSSFGIVTGNYTEKGKLHIYGDEEDATYATYEDRLKASLEEDPDKVMDVLTHVFGNLYETMTEKCAKTEISSALTFYNDKQYNNLLKDYEDDLDILEDRIKELEDRYYKQFTAMEKALSTLQNQSNSLASLLGTGQ